VLAEQSGVNREEIDPLAGLLLDRLQEDVVIDLFDLPALDDLIDRHRAEGYGAVGQQLAADGVKVAAGAEVHDRIGANGQGRVHLLDFRLDGASGTAGADVGVDLGGQDPPDSHRFEVGLQMERIGGDNQSSRCGFRPDRLGTDAFDLGDVLHGLGDLPGSGLL